jgi:hypothetical protein
VSWGAAQTPEVEGFLAALQPLIPKEGILVSEMVKLCRNDLLNLLPTALGGERKDLQVDLQEWLKKEKDGWHGAYRIVPLSRKRSPYRVGLLISLRLDGGERPVSWPETASRCGRDRIGADLDPSGPPGFGIVAGMRLTQSGTGRGQVVGQGRIDFHAQQDRAFRSCAVRRDGDSMFVPLLPGLAFDQWDWCVGRDDATMLQALERQLDHYGVRGIPSDFLMRQIGRAPYAAWQAV